MTIKIPEEKSVWVAVAVGFLYCMWRGLLHMLRIKPYSED